MGTTGARKRLCPVSSLSLAKVAGLDESWLLPDGSLNAARLPDCDTFCAAGIAAAAGYANSKKFWRRYRDDARFHTHMIATPDGVVIGRATCTTSAAAFGAMVREEGAARRQANLMQGPPIALAKATAAPDGFLIFRTT